MLEKLIHELRQDLSMEEVIPSPENHRYLLPFEDDITVEAMEINNGYLLKGVIGECPTQHVDPFLLQIMEANLFGLGTRGAAIGLNEEGKLLTLSLGLDDNLSFKDFKEKLEDFVSVIDFWRKRVQVYIAGV